MKNTPAKNPTEYLAALSGWQHDLVVRLRKAVRTVEGFDELIKWGHLVYTSTGPALLIRAEGERVLFGFWRGQRMLEIEPRLKPGGKYEMATMELREGDAVKPAVARKLAEEAFALNESLGDPRDDAKPKAKRAAPKTTRKTSRKTKRSK